MSAKSLFPYLTRLKAGHSLSRALPCSCRRAAHSAPIKPAFAQSKRLFHQTIPMKQSSGSKDLFRYTSGRWLVDEKVQQQARYVKFNLDQLCRLAATQFSDTAKCTRVVKLEGNFNKALLLTMDDGNEVIAKLPCPNAGPQSLTTASEVATLKFLQSRTSIRVPRVFAWSSDAANPVGAEFIIMEKIGGVALAETWATMSTLQRYKVIDQVVQVEKELAGIAFPAYGSLFLRESLPAAIRQYPLPPELDPEGLFCIGPSCKRTWWHGNSVDMSRSLSKDLGPWVGLPEYASSTVQREFAHIAGSGAEVQRELDHFDESQSADEYQSLLERVNMILPTLSHDERVLDFSEPVLWHTDLHLGNIFVSPSEPSTIEGIIDWQSAQSAPLFLQARFPDFLTPPKNYTIGPDLPGLPDGFEDLSPEQQEQATNEKDLALRCKYYEMSCLAHNQHVHDAMRLDRRLWEPFVCSQLSSHGSLVPIRECLIRLSEDWSALGLQGNCPFQIPEDERKKHDEQRMQYEDSVYLWDLVTKHLLTDSSGWVPHDRWEATKEANRELYTMYSKMMSEELAPEAARRIWPFPPEA
ncbi:uncharacterized protein DSM5745_09770 [Aspergillus mulundensis]|uniref:Altered inheritance of mitochondria protein 9, mitochondrial n=1 Tax=Aspergillus mulundensis TaxID=1810919 RepID=A0A3D8QRB8_9EURO|nr:Uncharacterized protein DSM5745_09770 [Aspergillus mulundensis]RDW64359.1 Uncharacterized protein DSM5745_09770 [Aspergillus mulundensis]